MDEINWQNSIQDRRCQKRAIKRACPICGIEFYGIHNITGKFGSKNRRFQKYCGKECWNKRATIFNKCQFCGKVIKTYKSVNKKYCNLRCRNQGMIGKKLSKEVIDKMSLVKKGKLPKNHWQAGDKHPFWNPDRTDQRERNIDKYKQWRYAIIKRDKWTCQLCRDKRSSNKKFCVDHIKPFSTFPELRYKIENGRVLCVECHRKTPTYGKTNSAMLFVPDTRNL